MIYWVKSSKKCLEHEAFSCSHICCQWMCFHICICFINSVLVGIPIAAIGLKNHGIAAGIKEYKSIFKKKKKKRNDVVLTKTKYYRNFDF